jgi:GH25 family lysozyme M1 (1,4-beta-N-acetylmuramidase)
MSARICPTCQGTRVGCPTCSLPPKRILPKATVLDKLYKTLYGTINWEVQGVDLSKWNGQMSFGTTKTKCQYVIMRLGYGTQWKDPNCDIFYRDARAQDMPVGVYWFCNIGQDANLTATSFAEEIATHNPQLDIVLDAEYTVLEPTGTLNWLKAVDTKLTALTGKKAMIYTSAGFWNAKVARSSYWSGRMLWVANWTARDTPTMPLDWYAWSHWQWSADGNQKGAEYGSSNGDPDMDLDRFNGTCVQFNAKYGTHIIPISGSIPPPPPPPPGTVPEMVIVNTGDANLRHAPNPSDPNNICGDSKMGMKLYPEAIEKDQYGAEWYKLGKKIYIKKLLTRLP